MDEILHKYSHPPTKTFKYRDHLSEKCSSWHDVAWPLFWNPKLWWICFSYTCLNFPMFSFKSPVVPDQPTTTSLPIFWPERGGGSVDAHLWYCIYFVCTWACPPPARSVFVFIFFYGYTYIGKCIVYTPLNDPDIVFSGLPKRFIVEGGGSLSMLIFTKGILRPFLLVR